MARIITYECDECGCEIFVRETPETELAPIYCCGEEVTEVPSAKKKTARAKKPAAKKQGKKAAGKVAARPVKKVAKKKTAPKKKATGKSK
ncbi:MAG: hypothetical protein M1497_02160 [Nitrospirae bacterium]|nr:hypothetical protein [Nitrospirota bacterium]